MGTIYLYSHDGSELLDTIPSYSNSGFNLYIDDNYIYSSEDGPMYLYTGSQPLIGLATEPNATQGTTPIYLSGQDINIYLVVEVPPYETVTDPTPYIVEAGTLKTIANAIRSKTGGTEEMTLTGMIDAIMTLLPPSSNGI